MVPSCIMDLNHGSECIFHNTTKELWLKCFESLYHELAGLISVLVASSFKHELACVGVCELRSLQVAVLLANGASCSLCKICPCLAEQIMLCSLFRITCSIYF